MKKESKDAGNSLSAVVGWQVLGNFLTQGIALFSTPIFTRILSPSDYGQTATFSSWCAIVGVVIGLQLSGTIGIAKNKMDRDEFESYCSSTLFLSLCSFAIFQIVFWVIRKPLANFVGFPEWLVPLIVMYSFSSYVITFFSTKLEYDFKIELKTAISAFMAIVTTALSLALAISFDENKYIGKILGTILPVLFISLFEMVVVFRNGKTIFVKSHWEFGLRLSLPLIFHVGAGVILAQSDIVMLKNLVNETETGIYSVVYSLAAVVNIIWVSFNHAWLPFYYKYKKENDICQIVQRSQGYMFSFTIITMGFILCAPEVFKLIAPKAYWSGLSIIPLVAGAYYINFLYSFPANHEFFHENTKILSFATVLSAVFNVINNYMLIPRYKSVGAALATIISYCISFLIHDICARYLVGDYEYSIKFYFKGIIPVLLVIVLYYFLLDNALIRWIIAVIIGCVLLARMIKKKQVF